LAISRNAVTYRLKSGDPFVAHPNDALSSEIYQERSYDDIETRSVLSILKEGDIAIDAGANIGYYTALMSRCVGADGKVYSFEPGRITFQKLQTTIRRLKLKNVVALEKALGEQATYTTFWGSINGCDAQQSLSPWAGMDWVGGKYTCERVQVVRLDEILDHEGVIGRVALIKIDVEGNELAVLDGSLRMLTGANPPVILIEINGPSLEAYGHLAERVLDACRDFDLLYIPLSMDQPAGIKREWEPLTPEARTPRIMNVLALPRVGRFSDRGRLFRGDASRNGYGPVRLVDRSAVK
jgi:FkbM family methyltransferase